MKFDDGATLGIRYAELLRLREYVQRLESPWNDAADRRAIVKQYEFENGRRVRPFNGTT